MSINGDIYKESLFNILNELEKMQNLSPIDPFHRGHKQGVLDAIDYISRTILHETWIYSNCENLKP